MTAQVLGLGQEILNAPPWNTANPVERLIAGEGMVGLVKPMTLAWHGFGTYAPDWSKTGSEVGHVANTPGQGTGLVWTLWA